MDVRGIDHIEFYVADADETADYLMDSFGFMVCGHGGPETGMPECRSVALRQEEISLVVTSAQAETHPAAGYVRRHDYGVAAIALTVADARACFDEALRRGAAPVSEPVEIGPPGRRLGVAAVAGPAGVVYRLVTREDPETPVLPGMAGHTAPAPASHGILRAVDHVALCVAGGELEPSVRRYEEIFGFKETFEDRIEIGSQAMNSKVVQSASGEVTFVVLEPDTALAPGRIDHFLTAHGGPGVQHLAFLADDIVTATRAIGAAGVRFLPTPSSYYRELVERLGPTDIPVAELEELSVLADRDPWGTLYQIFTESQHPRGTYFWELIDRRGARTFGNDNILALYEAVEREANLHGR